MKANSMLAAALFAGSFLTTGSLPRIRMDAGNVDEAITRLQAQVEELSDASAALVAAADAEGRDLTDEEVATIEANAEKVTGLDKQIKARSALKRPAAGTNRKVVDAVDADGKPRISGGARREDPRGGFRSFGEFAATVRNGSIRPSDLDTRLRNSATTYGNEGTGTDGGFLIPPEFSREIMTKVMAEENLLNRCTPLVVSGNSMTIPKDETTPWQTSGGILTYWEGEGAPTPASKPAMEMSTLRLAKLTALVPISDELLEDATGLESWLRAKAPAKMAAKINTAIVNGTGVGQPLGILRSPSVVSVAKETSQAADSIYFANINKMWSRMYASWRRNAVWLINQDIEPQLDAMAFDPAATSKVPVYLPPGGVSNTPYATLKGRPVVPVEACSTLGDQGDIILVDLSQYWGLTKAGGVRTDTSIHLYFDQSLTTFRFVFRMNGMPAWSSAITPENGTNTRSWAVTLDDRA
jgi:HK97 family phage major capsid protein